MIALLAKLLLTDARQDVVARPTVVLCHTPLGLDPPLAREAVKGFPKNINVSALLSLAGLGPDKTTVRIVTSPEYTRNSHEIKVVGDFGEVTTRTENVPDPSNPRTSYLAALSVCALLKKILGPIWLGT